MMRMRRRFCLTAALFLMAACAIFPQKASAEVISDGDGVVIYLDAGHDTTHSGCYTRGLHEETLNLKIAEYCKEKLEEYEGVTVYMSREAGECPNPGTSSNDDNITRVEEAVSKNADLYVALHNNSSASSSARGATVYYPNNNYNKTVSETGKAAATDILKNLSKIGLKDRGLNIRNSEDGTKYPDNSMADYYMIIKTAKLMNMPAIIVEHAFMTNKGDVNSFLGSDEALRKLGAADARGIADYYGLKKKKTTRVNLKKVAQVKEDKVKITWSAFDGADYYIVCRRKLLEPAGEDGAAVYSKWERIGKTRKEYYCDKDFEADTTYYYTVKAHIAETDSFSKKHTVGFGVTTK